MQDYKTAIKILEDNNIKFLDYNWKQNLTKEELASKEILEKMWNAAYYHQQFLEEMFGEYFDLDDNYPSNFNDDFCIFGISLYIWSFWEFDLDYVFYFLERNDEQIHLGNIINHYLNSLSKNEIINKTDNLTLFEYTIDSLINEFKNDSFIKIPIWNLDGAIDDLTAIFSVTKDVCDELYAHYNNIGISLDNCDSFNKTLKYINEAEEAINSYMVKDL